MGLRFVDTRIYGWIYTSVILWSTLGGHDCIYVLLYLCNLSDRVWDASTGEVKATLSGHLGAVSCVAFSSGGKAVISGSLDGTIR